MKIKIANRMIGEGYPGLIIAEAGVNHNGSFEIAKRLVDATKAAGADVVKFQTFKADKEAIKTAPKADYQKELTAKEESQYEMIRKLELPDEQTIALKKYADKIGIIFMSTPYEIECVDLLCRMHVPALKVGSGEITNHPLLEKMGRTKLPVIMSTGMSTLQEVRNAYDVISRHNNKIILLQCTTNYPARLENSNLRVMKTFSDEFKCPVGFSDHTPGIVAPIAAVAYGANVIEKHFTIDKNLPGPDHKASLSAGEFSQMVKAIRFAEKFVKRQFDESNYHLIMNKIAEKGFITKKEADDSELLLGSFEKRAVKEELEVKKVTRRSIVAIKRIKKGEIIKRAHLSFKKPGTGIPPFEINKVIGKRAKMDIDADVMIKWNIVE